MKAYSFLRMKFHELILAAVGALSLLAMGSAAWAQSVNIALSQVGNPGNAADSTGYGSVNYTYDIGTYDVTEDQYAAFLNAVAQTDTYDLYNSELETNGNIEGITQSGVSGSFTYSVIGTSGSDPVTYVSWLDAARFCNWLDNGQPANLGESTGSTETGAYNLEGDMDASGTTGLEMASASAIWRLPTENEWYKAAYYDPNYGGPGVGGYWTYATQSDTAPGNVVGSGSNEANYKNGVYSVTQSSTLSGTQNYLTPVGSFTASASYYGTFDQSGDVFDWNDAILGSSRGLRGGSWDVSMSLIESSGRGSNSPAFENYNNGFRLVEAVPEPTSIMLILSGVAGVALMRGRPFHRRRWS